MKSFPKTITKSQELLRARKLSAVELVRHYLDQIQQFNHLNAFITVDSSSALSQAQEADTMISQGVKLPLLGIPISLKDLYTTRDLLTTAGSQVLSGYIPPFDATVVTRLKNAGAIVIGKTNQDAWGHGSSGENSDFKPTLNPWNTKHVPGGSSSGGAVSVAADMCLASGATDTGGSIRQPASFCNVVGLKPTYGRVSRYGIIAMASSLDTVGHITKTVEDNALYLQVTAGHDPFDATSGSKAAPSYTKNLKNSVKGLKIGVPKEYFGKGLDPQVAKLITRALNSYEKLGAQVIEISLPNANYANECYYIIMSAEVSSNLARYDGIRFSNIRTFFGEEARRRIMLGSYSLSSGYYDEYYKKAASVRAVLSHDFETAWKSVDIIAAPISPTLPWKLGEKVDDPLAMYLSDIYTITANLVGIPGLALPVGFIKGLPVGMQLLGPHFSESLLYKAAYAYEQINKWYEKEI